MQSSTKMKRLFGDPGRQAAHISDHRKSVNVATDIFNYATFWELFD
jgi:hypothetical protein